MHEFRENNWLTNLLRVLAITGTGAVLVREMLVAQPLQQNQYYSFYPLALIAACSIVFLFAFMPAITISSLKKPDVLVPIGLYVTLIELTNATWKGAMDVAISAFQLDYRFFTFSTISGVLTHFVIGTIFTGWMARVLLDHVKTGNVNLLRAFSGISKWYPRTVAVIFFGVSPFLLLVIPLLVSAASGAIWLIIIAIGIGTLIWNLATYGLLVHVLNSPDVRLTQAIREGMQISWANKGKVAVVLVPFLLISGWLVLLGVQFYHVKEKANFFEQESMTMFTQTQINTNFVWTPTFPDSNEWYKGLMKTVKATPLPSIELRFMLLMLILSAALNIKIIGVLLGKDDLSRSESAVHREGGKGAGIAIFACLMIAMIPFEYLSAIGSTDRHTGKQKLKPETEVITVPKVYEGGDVFKKEEIFRREENIPSNVVSAYGVLKTDGVTASATKEEKIVEVTEESDADKLESINEVYAGEMDDESGPEILVAGRNKAYILAADGKLKREFAYGLGKVRFDSIVQDRSMAFARIVDLDGVGKPEIAGYGPFSCSIVNLAGKIVWMYPGKKDVSDVDSLRVGDLDNDGRNEVVVGVDNTIETYSLSGKLLWTTKVKSYGTYYMEIADLDGDGVNEVLTDEEIFDNKGKNIGEIKMSVRGAGFMRQKGERFGSLVFKNNVVGIFDPHDLIGQFEAPYSDKLTVFRAEAMRVRFRKDGEKYFAVAGAASSLFDSAYFKLLYIYDSNRKLVYHESILTNDMGLAVLPNADGSESLLVNGGGKLFKYSM